MEILKDFIKPELLVLIPVLYILGKIIKKTKKIKDNYIPLSLGIIGIILASIYNISTSSVCTIRCFLMCLFVGVTQGILCAGMSVYANQLISVQPKKENKK